MAEREIYLGVTSRGPGVLRHSQARVRGRIRVTFFVHGYNVDAQEAKRSFDQLVSNIRREARIPHEVVSPMLDGAEACRIYWPAYGRFGLNRSVLSALTYPRHVADVDEWATALASHLANEFRGYERTPVDVTFVAHSLGCRLILEALRLKLESKCTSWSVRIVFLMAPAVPVRLVRRNARLFAAAQSATHRCVAYSPVDFVLQIAFRGGQLPEGGLFPTAIGSSGQPKQLWTNRLPTRNGHSGYFNDRRTVRLLAETLGLPIARELDTRAISPQPTLIRAIGKVAALPLRIFSRRRIGS